MMDIDMKVSELMKLLSKMDPNKEVTIWNCELDQPYPIDEVVEKDDEVVLY